MPVQVWCFCFHSSRDTVALHAPFQNVAPHVQSMLMQAMTEWYLQNDTPDYTRMSRILDVAQDLKAL